MSVCLYIYVRMCVSYDCAVLPVYVCVGRERKGESALYVRVYTYILMFLTVFPSLRVKCDAPSSFHHC